MELSGDFVWQYNLPAVAVRWIGVLWRAPLLMLATGMLLARGGVGPGDGDDRAAHQGVTPAK